MTCFLNRHYVTPDLKEVLENTAKKMDQKYPGCVTAYLDANFPFFQDFPLFPHLSHDDGEKADIAFFYIDKTSERPLQRKAPSFIGYGVFEGPRNEEPDYPAQCSEQGFWQYSIMERFIPQGNKKKMILDKKRTAAIVKILASQQKVGKIFIEPHLKIRLQLDSKKIRYHGCHAVRHDDHIHVQL